METRMKSSIEVAAIARRLAEDVASIGDVTYKARLAGYALIDDGVMFGFVEADGTAYLRASPATAERFHHLGSTKHPQMPYWAIPSALSADKSTLRDLAYEAADTAHLAASFGVYDFEASPKGSASLSKVFSFALALAA